MYCLDTSTVSFALKGKLNVTNKILQIPVVELSTTVITEIELSYGAYNSSNIEYNLDKIQGFLDNLNIFNLDSKCIEIFAKEKTRLKKLGQIVEDMDILIASICLKNNLILVTDNSKHFKRFDGLKLENWLN